MLKLAKVNFSKHSTNLKLRFSLDNSLYLNSLYDRYPDKHRGTDTEIPKGFEPLALRRFHTADSEADPAGHLPLFHEIFSNVCIIYSRRWRQFTG